VRRLIALLALALAPPGALAAASDYWITLQVKLSLFGVEELSPATLEVDTVEGRVTLHGAVESAAARTGAETAAKAVEGVEAVRNLLQIVPAERRGTVAADDAAIERRIRERFAAERTLREGEIVIASVLKGLVRLGGRAESVDEHVRAIELAREIEGVRAVASDVVVADEAPTLDAAVWDARELDGNGRAIGEVARDLWVTTEVKLALLATPGLDSLEVGVDTRRGRVTLFGIVPTQSMRRAAIRVAREVRGAGEVRSHLQVVAESARPAVERTDAAITAEVPRRLHEIRDLAGAAIRAKVSKGVVRLTGTVPTAAHRLRAARVAREVPGVRAVVSDLVVRRLTRMRTPKSAWLQASPRDVSAG
jgi:hyperosmotically inducible periplasmic protein